jgi:predicted O-methyltransferase YrrM
MEFTIGDYVPQLAKLWEIDESTLHTYLAELNADREFLAAINERIRNVPEFGGKQFTSVSEMRAYRSLLYLVARAATPETFIETGVLNGMSSSFILLGLHHAGTGTLHSIDLPPVDQRIIDQGTIPLPAGRQPGWIIPDYLRPRHDLRLGPAERLLPELLGELGRVDVFLHDSDHSYQHIAFELGAAWRYLASGGHALVDNVEQNAAFADFARGVGATSLVVSTFDGPDRVWQHGVMRVG